MTLRVEQCVMNRNFLFNNKARKIRRIKVCTCLYLFFSCSLNVLKLIFLFFLQTYNYKVTYFISKKKQEWKFNFEY